MKYSTYLQHHGILGQKWGKKNGPPYPLDEQKHSNSEKKAGWKKSLDGPIKRKEIIKKVIIGSFAVGTVAEASVYVAKHPEIIFKISKTISN